MKKYFFFDIDGTLAVGTTKIVPEDTRQCLHLLRQAGHFVAIATGRLQCDALGFGRALHIDSFVADGGNSLTYKGKLLEMSALPRKNCLALLQELDACRLPWAVVTGNETIRYTPFPEFAEMEQKSYFKTVCKAIDIAALGEIYKIFYLRPTIGKNQPNRCGLPHIPYSEQSFLVEPVDKAAGIRRLVHRLGGNTKDVVVFGDGLNDLNMFCPEWFSIAMGNGRPQLKAKADYITTACDQGGILKACQKFGWV
jgi:hydroxymethylpyrimidine pyrophosphatase-like HAD family hydrolase